jgi:hypothetical protein
MSIPLPALILFAVAAGLYLLFVAWLCTNLVLMARTWAAIDPDVALIDDPRAQMPEPAGARMHSLEGVLRALGFVPLGILAIRRPGMFETFLLTTTTPDRCTMGEVCIHYRKMRPKPIVAWMVVFSTSFENGASLATTNALGAPDGSPHSTRLTIWTREARNPALLLRLHEAAARREHARRKPIAVTATTLLPWFRDQALKEINDELSRGSCDISADRRHYRMRWGSILRILVRALPPVSTIRNLAARRAVRELLREADVSGQELRAARTWNPPEPLPATP